MPPWVSSERRPGDRRVVPGVRPHAPVHEGRETHHDEQAPSASRCQAGRPRAVAGVLLASGLGPHLSSSAILRSPEAATGRLGAALRALAEPSPARLSPGGPWLVTTLAQAREVLTDPRRFDFPLDVSRKPAKPAGAEPDAGGRTRHEVTPPMNRDQVALGREVFGSALRSEVERTPDVLHADRLLRRPVARATTAAVLGHAHGISDADRDRVGAEVLAWIDALAPVIAARRNPARWSRVRRAEERARAALEASLGSIGVADPPAMATVLAAGIQVPVAAGAWLLVHLASSPDTSAFDAAHIAWETLRVTPPTWVTARIATCDTTVGGQPLSAGEIVMVSPLVLGQLPELVPADDRSPHEGFDPGRWQRDDVRPGAWLPFGAGPHACPGRSLGLALLTDLAVEALTWSTELVEPVRLDQSRGLSPVPAVLRLRRTSDGATP